MIKLILMLFLVSGAILLLALTGFCQTDTLYFVESASIQPPDPVSQLYIQDLNGDTLQELIVCSEQHIFVYSGADLGLIWVSPDLVIPSDLKFADFDGDSLLDISCKCAAAVYLFDPLHSRTIWTSPELDERYICYAVGDRNADGGPDIGIMIKEPFTRYGVPNNMDSVWIRLYDYPDFDSSLARSFRIENYEYYYGNPWDPDEWRVRHLETPIALTINCGLGGESTGTVMLFCSIRRYEYPDPFYQEDFTGSVRVLRASDLSLRYTAQPGWPLFRSDIAINDSSYICSISSFKQQSMGSIIDFEIYSDILSPRNQRYRSRIWDGIPGNFSPACLGAIIDDIRREINGPEICYSVTDPLSREDGLTLRRIEPDSLLWHRNIYYIDTVLCTFKSHLFSHPQIICIAGHYITNTGFYDITNGGLTAILDIWSYGIDKAADYNYDGNDEVFSLTGGMLHIGSIQTTSVESEPSIPQAQLLVQSYPNPFNAQTTIRYRLPKSSNVSIDIFDITGRKIETLQSGRQPAGNRSVVWNAEDCPSGVYFYRLKAGETTQTQRCILLK